MRIDLSDLDRLEGIAEALGRLFWCLAAVAFFAAIFGSAGTGLLVLILAGAAFVGRVGFEDFVRSRRERSPGDRQEPAIGEAVAGEPAVTIHRAARRRRPRSAV